LLGYAHEEIIGANWFERFLPERARKEVEAIFVRLMAGVITPVEYTENVVLTRSGEERTVAWHNAVLRDGIGNITGTLSSGEDITERKRAQEELQRLSLVAAHTTNAVFITDAERRIEWVNQAFIQLTGFAPTEMRGKSSDEVLQGAETDPATVAAIRDSAGRWSKLRRRDSQLPPGRFDLLGSALDRPGARHRGPRHPVYRRSDRYHRAPASAAGASGKER
jgi:PAS domain S-box-containing protein